MPISARIKEIKDIPLDSLVIGKGQTRLTNVSKDIDELARSIESVGLQQPIVVCDSEIEGKYEILTGQRRFLAHKQLGYETIKAGILDGQVSDIEARVISLTENLVRTTPNQRDFISVCTDLYKRYGSIKAVAEETGLPANKVSNYVKYDRLDSSLQELVDSGEVGLKVALKAQDFASLGGEFDKEKAIVLAKDMEPMTGAQRQKVEKTVKEKPDRPVHEVVDEARTGEQLVQKIVMLTKTVNESLKSFAAGEGTKSEDAAASLIQDGLIDKGYIDED